MSRLLFLPILFVLTASIGCVDRPEVDSKTYGTILTKLPHIEAAAEPFKFPHAGENDHKNCVFKEEDFF